MDVSEAAARGSRRELLEALRDRIARAVADPDCPKRDLASLSLRLLDIASQIDALASQEGGDDLGEAAATPDVEFDSEAL